MVATRYPRWPLVLLVASIGLAAVAVTDALSAVRSQQRVTAEAIGGYSNFAAWSYQQHLREAMTAAAREALGAVNHGTSLHVWSMIPDAKDVIQNLPVDPMCLCHRTKWGPMPRAFFGFDLRADTLGVRATGRINYPEDDRAWIVDTLRRQIRSAYRSDWGFTYVVTRRNGVTRYLAYTLMPTVSGDTMVYGVEEDPAAFQQLIAGLLDATDLLPSAFTRSHSNRELLAIQVTDAQDDVVFASEVNHSWRYGARAVLPQSYGGLATRAEIRPEYAGLLIIGGLPKSHLPFLVVLVLLAAALAAVALAQVRREGELGRLRADFVANVSHELRTPLAQIRLDLDTVRLGRYPSDAYRSAALERVDREARRLTLLTENVLRFSRRDRTGVPSERIATDVAQETARIVDEFRPLAAARRATIAIETVGAPRAMLERDTLRHVILNLLDNAAKYGPSGQTIRVSVRVAGETVQVSVADEGAGVPLEERDLIWQPFRRGSEAARQGAGGSGMGLTIVRDIVARHGGSARVAGAVFTVAFPCLASSS